MFDVGFSELLVIAVVALLVLGPERLPKAARFAGLWVRRARTQWNSVKAELENELADEELRRNIRQARDELHAGLRETRALIEPTPIEPKALPGSSLVDDPHPPPQMTSLKRNGMPSARATAAAAPGTAAPESPSSLVPHEAAAEDRARDD